MRKWILAAMVLFALPAAAQDCANGVCVQRRVVAPRVFSPPVIPLPPRTEPMCASTACVPVVHQPAVSCQPVRRVWVCRRPVRN